MSEHEDIMEVAFALTAGDWSQPHDVRAKKVYSAILAERKRCADIARKDCRTALAIEHEYKPTWYVRALEIAAEIESGEQP